MKRLLLCAMLALFVVPLSGCWLAGTGTPADQVSNITYELAGLIGDAQTGIRDALKARALRPEIALAAATQIETKANLPLKHLLEELVKRLEPSGDKEVLVLTEADKGKLISSVNLFGDVAASIVNDPSIVNLDSATHVAVVSAIMAAKPLVIRLAALLQKAPTDKKIAPTLRQQLREVVQTAERARTKNDRLFDEITAEVVR